MNWIDLKERKQKVLVSQDSTKTATKFESKKEELEYYMPCFVYYDKPKGNGTVNRIGIAESFLGDKVIIREGNNTRGIYDIDNIYIINLND